MPAASMAQRKSTRKVAQRHQPYSRRPKSYVVPLMDPSSQASSATPHTAGSSTSPPARSRLRPMRDIFLQLVRKTYPYYTPKDDLELMSLSSGRYEGPPSGIEQFLKQDLARFHERGYEASLAKSKEGLDKLIEATGIKPSPGDPNVFVQPIPDSEFSVRLFPGCTEAKEYCLDFVRTTTGEAVNSPFPEFALFSAPGPDAPIGSGPVVSISPLECAFGMSRDQIPPGEEKFVVADGTTCVLQRPGHKDVRFTIPIRRPRNPPPKPVIDAHVLAFPQYTETALTSLFTLRTLEDLPVQLECEGWTLLALATGPPWLRTLHIVHLWVDEVHADNFEAGALAVDWVFPGFDAGALAVDWVFPGFDAPSSRSIPHYTEGQFADGDWRRKSKDECYGALEVDRHVRTGAGMAQIAGGGVFVVTHAQT
ncbi:hypothetical protein BD413DRAFT_617837 [Trametes elegans]|nr:hypothetical protein BD413DRAFT_617837 [Trametes elegans]